MQTEVGERARDERALSEAQDQLVQAAKQVAIGQMATGIAHELNQPLTALDSLAMATSSYVGQGDLATTAWTSLAKSSPTAAAGRSPTTRSAASRSERVA